MTERPSTERRHVIRGVASALLVGSLAGCSGESGGGDDTTTTTTTADTTTTTTTTATTTSTTTTTTTTQQSETVAVGPDTKNVFRPSSLEIPTGTEVTFVWRSGGHSLIVDSQPSGAGWEGVPETQSSGYEHTHTFEVAGTYEYYCKPHSAFGMEGTITVMDG